MNTTEPLTCYELSVMIRFRWNVRLGHGRYLSIKALRGSWNLLSLYGLLESLSALTSKGLLSKAGGERYFLTESGEAATLARLGP